MARVDRNAQRVAIIHELIRPDEAFTLTDDQTKAVDKIAHGLENGVYEHLLHAPTGSGKTEVLMRVALRRVLDGGYVVIIAPTRDLVRQHVAYFSERLESTGLHIAEIHGGVSPAQRRASEAAVNAGEAQIVIGSAMLLSIKHLWDLVDRSALAIIDDVNAFDEREHLRLLEKLDCPLVFASATPDELKPFLTRIGATKNVARMREMPFDVLPTKVHKIEGVWGEPPAEQLTRAETHIREHLSRGSRIFVIGRTRGDVPRIAERLAQTYKIDVQQLRGDMADTAEHRKRHRRKGVTADKSSTRVEMMQQFRDGSPSILAATNLVGSGLDVPAADLIVITDADAFGESEVEQLIGRVGRRDLPSDAVMLTGTTLERNPSKSMPTGRARTFMPRGMHSKSLRFRR
ncbi:MAG: helicase-related protein [Vulcanimicrobiaceae bacterium]|jgi:RecG-like helicase